MIAVLAENMEYPVVREFFELFKTPWEFYRGGHRHDVLICSNTQSHVNSDSAKLVLVYGGEQGPFDRENGIQTCSQCSNTVLSYKGSRIPIYGSCLTFRAHGVQALTHESTQEPAALKMASGAQTLVRIGFDLFREIRHLLTRGQPSIHARIPALELHIALLRDLIVSCSISLVEIPPVPENYSFIACLTHDVDHVGLRNHKCDHTMFGFLYRAILGSVISVCRGRKSIRQLGLNWAAAFSLPFVHLGMVKDFWYQFDRYLEIEKGLTSTFFVIPAKNDPGQSADGRGPAMRASRYDITDIADHIHRLVSAGHEIGLHGIDAWRDSTKGRQELERISHVTGASEVGVRMHWLFFDEQSPVTLEEAGFSYDSTVGYNDTIGYRAGTTQAFKPLPAPGIFELPMHIMDTALFYPAHMDLSPKEAEEVVGSLLENAVRFGGALTVNWHDRSIAPERLWDDFYVKLLNDLKIRGAWFSTASQAVSWFKKRRSTVIDQDAMENGEVRIKASVNSSDNLPGLRVRVHRPDGHSGDGIVQDGPSRGFVDIPFKTDIEVTITP